MSAGASVNWFCLAWETLGEGEWEALFAPVVRTGMPRVTGWYASRALVYAAFGEP